MVTGSTIYMALLGEQGLKNVASACMQNMSYLKQKLTQQGIKVLFDSPNFHEEVIQTDKSVKTIIHALSKKDIIAGVDISENYPELGQVMSICVTETKTHEDIDAYVEALKMAL